MSRPRWTYSGKAVLHEIRTAPPDVQEDFATLLYQLTRNPEGRAGALPSRDDTPGGWTAPFDSAMLFYQVLADHPHLYLLLIRWDEHSEEERG